jgi:hypothetical protein
MPLCNEHQTKQASSRGGDGWIESLVNGLDGSSSQAEPPVLEFILISSSFSFVFSRIQAVPNPGSTLTARLEPILA